MKLGRLVALAAVAAVAGAAYWLTPLGRGGAGVDGPVIHSGFSFGSGGEDALIEGVLALEGDCLYIEFPDLPGARYPTVWPHGTGWQDDPAGVILPGGEPALLGTGVSGGGGFHSERSRIESVTDREGAELAMRCAENPFREVAIFNPGGRVKRLDR